MSAGLSFSAKYHVVVLDDTESTRQLVALALQNRLGCTVTMCSNQKELENSATGTIPDLFLLDFTFEGKDGIQILKSFRKRKEIEGVPVIFFSEDREASTRAVAIKAGGADYLNKPFFPDELVARVRAHIELHRSHQALLAQITEQRALLRVLCHDLKNPVGAVCSLLDLVSEDIPANELLATAKRSAESALDLINHVSEYRVLTADDQQYKRQDILVETAFRESVAILQNQISRKELRIEMDVKEGLRVSINHVVLVHNILNNLLTNAIKFSYPGRPIELRGMVDPQAPEEYALIEVVDHGMGMPHSMVEDLFTAGAVESREGTAAEKGSGFGMALVRRYVDRFGGTIGVDSREAGEILDDSCGTTVRLRIPIAVQ